jgi:membrane-associated phospholipid phosphatase
VRPTERLTLLVLLALSAGFALVRPPGAGGPLLLITLYAAALLSVARPGERRGAAGVARELLPVVAVLLVYALLQPLIEAVNPVRWDPELAALDDRWFGPLWPRWRGLLGRPAWLTDAAYLAYVSYYALPIGVYAAARWREQEDGERVGVTLLLTFYLSYLGYLLLPASGPRVPRAEEALLGGSAISRAAREFLALAEVTTLDAFPSGHTALSLLSAALAATRFRRATPALAIWAAAIVFATVYISVHYVVDLVAGGLLAAAGYLLGPPLLRALGGAGPGATTPGRTTADRAAGRPAH